MMFFALYLSSRLTTVNSTSIAGLVIAKLPARRITVSTASAVIPGIAPSAPNPTMLIAGSSASVAASPSQRMIRPVKKICVTTVNTCAASSRRANTAVRAALLAYKCPTMSDCSKYKNVEPIVNRIMKTQMPSKYGERTTWVNPAHTLPPITSWSRAAPRTPPRVSGTASPPPAAGCSGKRTTVNTASSSNATDTSNKFSVPIRGANDAVTADPMIDPNVPPTPMNPNIRFACSLRKLSAIRHQKIDVLNSAKTVIQTKNARPVQMSTVDPSALDMNRNTP